MKKITVVIPCYNDSLTIRPQYECLVEIFNKQLQQYNYEIIFADDCSPDDTWNEIRRICEVDNKVKGVHNFANFGTIRNLFSCLKYGDGDAVFMLMGDMQDPPELLPEFVTCWENGCKVVVGQKQKTTETAIKRISRRLYYKLIEKFSHKKQISDFTGYGLYDRGFVDILTDIDDMQPYIKGIVSEFGGNNIHIIPYVQAAGERKSNLNFIRNYDYAMVGVTGYAKNLLRMCTFFGLATGIIAVLFAFFIFINKLRHWDVYPVGIPSVLIVVSFLGAIQLLFLGICGEYMLSINERSMKRPLVVVDEKLNFGD